MGVLYCIATVPLPQIRNGLMTLKLNFLCAFLQICWWAHLTVKWQFSLGMSVEG